MIQLRDRLRPALEARLQCVLRKFRGKDLDGDAVVEARVARLPHFLLFGRLVEENGLRARATQPGPS